jgi:hypothetical protein
MRHSISLSDQHEQKLSVVVMLRDRHDEPMFLVHCSACGQRELRGIQAISGLANTSRGIELATTCTNCGAEVRLLTGRAVAGAPTTMPARPAPRVALVRSNGGAGPATRPAA